MLRQLQLRDTEFKSLKGNVVELKVHGATFELIDLGVIEHVPHFIPLKGPMFQSWIYRKQ